MQLLARRTFVALHRYVGLSLAIFLTIAGLSGSLLAFKDRLDRRLNPDLFFVGSRGPELPPLELVAEIERADPHVRVIYATLASAPGLAAMFSVEPRVDPRSSQPFAIGYNQVFVDPVSGTRLGEREAGRIAFDRRRLMPLVYRVHTTMFLPGAWSAWLLAIVALVWLVHSCIGFGLTFPWRRFRQATLMLDVHRIGGAWFWILLVAIAMSGFCLQLRTALARPLMGKVARLTPIEPAVSYADVIAPAVREAARRGWSDPASSATYISEYGIYAVRFHPPSNDDGEWGFGVPALYYDGTTGRFLGEKIPRAGSRADVFLDLQFPLHSGLIGGVAGAIVVALAGVATTILSVTGVWMWVRRVGAH